MTSPRRFPAPWQVEQTPGGFKVAGCEWSGARETKAEADIAKVLTLARRGALL